MRSRIDLRLPLVVVVMLIVAMPFVGSAAAQHANGGVANALSDDEVGRALDRVKADPNLATEKTIKTLRWKASPSASRSMPAWMKWLIGLFRWIDQSARALVWCGAAILAGVLVVYIVRIVRTHGVPERSAKFVPPTHVHDLDIRPETLPDDVGAAARALWDRGEHRAALALLYRGLLSRLAYAHGIPIRDSSTEGDCLALAADHLPPRTSEYTSMLVAVWQRFVYGRQDVRAAVVYALCDDFAPVLGRRSSA